MGYEPITLPKSKQVVLVETINPFLLNKVRRDFKRKNPPPMPPIQQVNMGTPEAPVWDSSPNEAHPDYLEQRAEWTQLLEEEVRRFVVAMGVSIEWTDAKRARLDELRAKMKRAGQDEALGDDDTYAYVSYIAVSDGEDYQTLLRAVMEGYRPTEEAIAEAVETFRPVANGQGPDLQGEKRI